MLIKAIIQIIIGLFIWYIVPSWITQGNRSARDFIKLCCNVIGIIITIVGVINVRKSLGLF